MRSHIALSLLVALLAACSKDDGAATAPGARTPGAERPVGGTLIDGRLSDEDAAELQRLTAAIAADAALTTDELLARHAVPFGPALSYVPSQAAHLPAIQASALGLNAAELATLDRHGFVISERQRFPTFTYGYQSLYLEDLPLYVSGDSILHAMHRSYDEILKAVELASLIPELDAMLAGMAAGLAAGGPPGAPVDALRDADLYVAVARSLLAGHAVTPVAGADPALVQRLVAGATAHDGAQDLTIFGVPRTIDFSQFTPRGHYTDEEVLERYFRATMWVGRIDFRLVETQPDGSQLFHRRQLEAAAILGALLDGGARAHHERIDAAIRAFVGEPDNMTPAELTDLFAAVGVADLAGLATHTDEELSTAILAGRFGTQRISSHIMVNGLGQGTLPLSSTFLLLGQRYVVDSHVFSNVVYDRVQGGAVKRMMPSTFDAAFAALGNDQAAALLEPELRIFSYAPDLSAMRRLVDAHPADVWDANLYGLWLQALRTLSPAAELRDPAGVGLPTIAATEPWGRRLLNTQLASWAELRHDTILYAKQSYTGGASCEFPDAYVEPYPALFAAIGAYARLGGERLATLDLSAQPWLAEAIARHFTRTEEIAARLQGLAEAQRAGRAFTADELAFLNEAVVVQQGCGDPESATGWYAELFFAPISAVQYDPTIADVHTQPTDEGGAPVGRILHVGTGMPRLMVVTVDTCTGPKAYVGLASSYFERITEDFDRLDDERWRDELLVATPADPAFVEDFVVR